MLRKYVPLQDTLLSLFLNFLDKSFSVLLLCLSLGSCEGRSIYFNSAGMSVLFSHLSMYSGIEKDDCLYGFCNCMQEVFQRFCPSVQSPVDAFWLMLFLCSISKRLFFRLVQTVLENPVSKCFPCNCYSCFVVLSSNSSFLFLGLSRDLGNNK